MRIAVSILAPVVCIALAGCQTTSPETAGPPRISVANQTYDVVYVPVVEFRDATGRTANDSGSATPSLDQCKLVIGTLVNRPQPTQFQGMMVSETACYEVQRDGQQRKIKLS
ncbi:hypothetical protein FHS85_004366 [Rhodoligotrophos appendicifer]|uniref:hypothetical protein n=1 Tax=Rhodoligotrophos appendicifer TaxID=987056 RepID=UPI0011857F18|nr:hypothetical protein [Rhodoligotrophos appendicifer]